MDDRIEQPKTTVSEHLFEHLLSSLYQKRNRRMFSYFFFLLYMAGSVLNHGAGSSILNRSPSFPRFFEDSVPGIRCGGVRKASTVWRQVAIGR
jgi:hypothetical protein